MDSLANSHVPWFAGVLDAASFLEIQQNPQGELFRSVALCSALEIRYDLICEKNGDECALVAEKIKRLFPKALLIGTIRLVRDGGGCPTEVSAKRVGFFQRVLSAGVSPDFVDVGAEELGVLSAIAGDLRKSGTRFFVSHHDFEKIPSAEELASLVAAARNVGANGFKTACMSSRPQDFDRLYPFIQQNAPGFELFSLFAMGESGEESRIKSLAFGANLTYCSLAASVAPGQIPVRRAIEIFENMAKIG